MADLIPVDCLSLVELHNVYLDYLWSGARPFEELEIQSHGTHLPIEIVAGHLNRLEYAQQLEWQGLIRLFIDGTFEALARPASSATWVSIPRTAWEEMFFPERVFLSDGIVRGHGEYWDLLIGCTPFVKREQVERWLETRRLPVVEILRTSDPLVGSLRTILVGLAMDGVYSSTEVEAMAKRWTLPPISIDPGPTYPVLELSVWSLPMAVAWIVWRTPEAVCEQWDDYRKKCWDWISFHRRLPLDGGKEWYEVHGEELKNRHSASVGMLGTLEALCATEVQAHGPGLMTVKEAGEALWNHLANGSLRATATSRNGEIVQIPPHEWHYLELAHQPDLTDFLINRHQTLDAVYENIGLNSQDLTRIWPARKPNLWGTPTSQLFEFREEDSHWTLFEAAVWVGCEGKELPTDQISNEALHEIGAKKLFVAMFRNSQLTASGVNANLIREDIPGAYWELATTDPAEVGHYVDFVDDHSRGYWGELTPSGETLPRWSRIEVETRALKRLFPFGKAKPTSCRKWLEDIMRDSPRERPQTKRKYQAEAIKRFRIPVAGFERAWREALENVPEAKPFWTLGGRPKTPKK